MKKNDNSFASSLVQACQLSTVQHNGFLNNQFRSSCCFNTIHWGSLIKLYKNDGE